MLAQVLMWNGVVCLSGKVFSSSHINGVLKHLSLPLGDPQVVVPGRVLTDEKGVVVLWR